MKRCTQCNIEQSYDCFNKSARNKDGLKFMCRDCDKKDQRERYHFGGGKEKTRIYNIERKYGLSNEQYLEMISDGCNICRTDIDLVVDHCHDTGAVRGILCRPCNTGIGNLRDNAELVARAYAYLTGGMNVA